MAKLPYLIIVRPGSGRRRPLGPGHIWAGMGSKRKHRSEDKTTKTTPETTVICSDSIDQVSNSKDSKEKVFSTSDQNCSQDQTSRSAPQRRGEHPFEGCSTANSSEKDIILSPTTSSHRINLSSEPPCSNQNFDVNKLMKYYDDYAVNCLVNNPIPVMNII